MSDISQRLARLERGILAAVKDTAQRIPQELSIYVGDYMQGPQMKTGMVTAKSGNRYFKPLNNTDRLRTLYGNIQRAITPGDKGNVSRVELRNGKFQIEFGYDPQTMVKSGTRNQSLMYAVYNEMGTARAKARPFLRPGFLDYMRDANGFKALIKELETTIVDEFMQEFG
jgi:hypothetical protein